MSGKVDPKAENRDPNWSRLHTDLKNAVDTWTVLTEQLGNKMSPEERQLKEIKSLLGALKDKLDEFNESPNPPTKN